MKYLEDSRLTQLTSDLTEAFLNTRGTGFTGGLNPGNSNRTNRGVRGKKQNQKQQPSTPAKGGNRQSNRNPTSSYSYAYNSAGYSSYGVGSSSDGYSTSSSSCRVIYGRVEAYTTKRAGSDKKTAHEVGERYAHEMERLNEAVEELKRKHLLEKEQHNEAGDSKNDEGAGNEGELAKDNKHDNESEKKSQEYGRRRRSRSVDVVTFAPSTSSRIVSTDAIASLPEDSVVSNAAAEVSKLEEELLHPSTATGKREHPIEGILKPPSSNKRWRATSFDISTGPSTLSKWNTAASDAFRSGGDEDDKDTHPLIPQPSLYQSSLGDSGEAASLPPMVPRRLVTDLILTLNASFPDYDFGEARPSDFCTLSLPEATRRINEKLSEFAATTDKGRDFLPRFWSALDDVVFGLKDAEVYSYSPRAGGGDDDPLGFLTNTLAAGNDSWIGNNGDEGVMAGVQGDLPIIPNRRGAIGIEGGLFDSSTTLDLPHHILPTPAVKSDDSAHVTLWTMNYFFVSRNKKRIVLFACVQTMRTPQGYEEEDDDQNDYEYGENDLVFDEARRGRIEEEKEGGYAYPMLNATRNLKGDDSVMVEDDEEERVTRGTNTDIEGADVDVDEDDDGEEIDFDMDDETGPGTLAGNVPPPPPPSDRMATA